MGIRGRLQFSSTMVLTLALAAGATGCAASPPGEASAPTSSDSVTAGPSSTATASASASPAAAPAASSSSVPEPTATPEAAAACDTALSSTEYDQLAADGLTLRTAAVNDNLDAVMAAGGIRCLWRVPSSDVEAWYAQWPSDQATWDALSAELLSGGATTATGDFPGVEQYDYNSALTYRDGVVYYASPARLFGSVLALQ